MSSKKYKGPSNKIVTIKDGKIYRGDIPTPAYQIATVKDGKVYRGHIPTPAYEIGRATSIDSGAAEAVFKLLM